MKQRLKVERHEFMYGPHFNEKQALKAVSKMENEDGTTGAHWSLELTTSLADEFGVNLKGSNFNKYDWYVALNMVYSDFYKVIASLGNNKKDFIEIAKAWLADKDIDEGKMWYYYIFIMCDKLREEIFCHEYDEDEEDDEDEYEERYHASKASKAKHYKHLDEDEDDEVYRKPVHVRYLSRY